MNTRRELLGKEHLATSDIVRTFLGKRLEERESINWAINLKSNEIGKRLGVRSLVDNLEWHKISEPWQSTWQFIVESWDREDRLINSSMDLYSIQARLRAGNKSGLVIDGIVNLVAPLIKLSSRNRLFYSDKKLPTKVPKQVGDLFSISLSGGRDFNFTELELEQVDDKIFLNSLCLSLETELLDCIEIASRLGWKTVYNSWQLGSPNRVYFVPPGDRPNGHDEPDRYKGGIATLTKLLYAVAELLGRLDNSLAVEFARRCKMHNSSVHIRLWAALSRNPVITSAEEVEATLLALDNRRFWDVRYFPEIAELKSVRFDEFGSRAKKRIASRIKRLPPRSFLASRVDSEVVEQARRYWAVRELRRIEVAGGNLHKTVSEWLRANVDDFQDLAQMERVDHDFIWGLQGGYLSSEPDEQYDLLSGLDRLKRVETSLSPVSGQVDHARAEGARTWIGTPGNPIKLIADFETAEDGGNDFPAVWEKFGWSHSRVAGKDEDLSTRNFPEECERVLALLDKLSGETLGKVVGGVSYWMSAWGEELVKYPRGFELWQKIWPFAVDATNLQKDEEERELDTTEALFPDDETVKLDNLNTPVGRFLSVFLDACPNLKETPRPFENNAALYDMRGAIEGGTGYSKQVALYCIVESLPYFLQADEEWANEHLINPLLLDGADDLVLWNAVARRTQYRKVLKVIGLKMAESAINLKLSNETRESLVFSVVLDQLFSFLKNRDPAVLAPNVQQMLRLVSDEVRAFAADVIKRFVEDNSVANDSTHTAEELVRSAALPFLSTIWPQERSLVTSGVSRSLAGLPALAKNAFEEAFEVIKRFLVPFECWTMHDYELHGIDGDGPKFNLIDTPGKAGALLQILDLTVGTAEGSVVPRNLPDALNKIAVEAPGLVDNMEYRRLATAARGRS
jgi:hypothetical protein